jgi:hypothetical protein
MKIREDYNFPHEVSQSFNRTHPKRQIIKWNKKPIEDHKEGKGYKKL